MLVVVTDGYVAADRECITLIRDNLDRASVFAYGIGSSVNRYLIEATAHDGAGQPFIVTDPEQAEQQRTDHLPQTVSKTFWVELQAYCNSKPVCEPGSLNDAQRLEPIS